MEESQEKRRRLEVNEETPRQQEGGSSPSAYEVQEGEDKNSERKADDVQKEVKFESGDHVILKGLTSRNDLNNQVATLMTFVEATGRWKAKLGNDSVVNVCPRNLEKVEEPIKEHRKYEWGKVQINLFSMLPN